MCNQQAERNKRIFEALCQRLQRDGVLTRNELSAVLKDLIHDRQGTMTFEEATEVKKLIDERVLWSKFKFRLSFALLGPESVLGLPA